MGNFTGLLNKYKKFQEGGISMDDLNVDMSDLGMQEQDFERQRGKAVQSQVEGRFKPEAFNQEPDPVYPIEPPVNDAPEIEAPEPMTIDRAIAQASRKKDERVKFYNNKKAEATSPAEEMVATVIAQTESSFGRNRKHRRISKGLNKAHQAAGDYGLMPLTIKDRFAADKNLQKLYPEIYKLSQKVKKNKRKGADALTAVLNDNHEASYKIAVSEFDRVLKQFDGDVEHALNAWFYGVSGTKRRYKKDAKIPTKSTRHLKIYREGARNPSSLGFEDGGIPEEEEDFALDQSFAPPAPPEKLGLLEAYKAEQAQYKVDEAEAKKKQMYMKMMDSIGRNARKASSGYAQMKGGMDLKYKEEKAAEIPSVEDLGVKKPATLDDALKLAKIKSQISKAGITGGKVKYTPVRVKGDNGKIRTMMVNIYNPNDTKDVGETGYSSETLTHANDKIYKVTEDFEKNAVKKELDKQGISFEQADGLLEEIKSGNEIALGALGTKMARAMGEVGVLTDADVTRYIQSQSYLRMGRDYYTRRGEGKLYDTTLKDMERVINKMRSGFKTKRKKIFSRYVNKAYLNYGKLAGLEKKEVYERFGFGHDKQFEEVGVILPNGKTGKIPRSKVEAFKKKYPKAQVLD